MQRAFRPDQQRNNSPMTIKEIQKSPALCATAEIAARADKGIQQQQMNMQNAEVRIEKRERQELSFDQLSKPPEEKQPTVFIPQALRGKVLTLNLTGDKAVEESGRYWVKALRGFVAGPGRFASPNDRLEVSGALALELIGRGQALWDDPQIDREIADRAEFERLKKLNEQPKRLRDNPNFQPAKPKTWMAGTIEKKVTA
jgi:hypothetical protein